MGCFSWTKADRNTKSANIASYAVTTTIGTGTSLTVKEGSTTVTNVSGTKYVLKGTALIITGSANTGYNQLELKVNNNAFTSGNTHTVSGTTTITTSAEYIETPTITRNDYNTFKVSSTSGAKYIISTTHSTKPEASLTEWGTTTTQDTSTSAKETWYVWVQDSSGKVSPNKATITNYKVTLTAGTGTTLTAKADTASGATVNTNTNV